MASLVLLGAFAAAAPAQSTDATTVETAILDVLLARGLIDAAQYEELLALARATADDARGEIELLEGRLARLRAPDLQTSGGQAGKLLFKSSDGKWSLGLKGRIQARAEHVDADDDSKDGDNISVPRSRIGVEGTAGAENVGYRLEWDMNTNKKLEDPAKEGSVNLRHAFINWGFENGMQLIFGQTKFPFGRESLTSSGSISLAERSLVSSEFFPEYEPLAMLQGTADDGEWEWYLAASNGEGRGKNNTSGEDLDGMRRGARVVWNPLGRFKLDAPAFQTLDSGETRIGLGASWMRNADSSGLSTATADVDSESLGLEFQAFSGPWSVLYENVSRDEHDDAAADDDDDGQSLQVGWFLTERWELVVRRAEVDYDTKADKDERALGLNWYVDRHNGKWQLEWNEQETEDDDSEVDTLRVQYQLIF
ncbi:MAG: hypothetical protein FJ296_04985 [Planctomycetes bacterium]|nr:hypothetical protein [Planctomycetota bacterium]